MFAAGFVLTKFTVADFDWTSFIVQYSYAISSRHIIIVVDVDSMSIVGSDTETVLGLLHALFAVAIDLFAAIHQRMPPCLCVDLLPNNCCLVAVLLDLSPNQIRNDPYFQVVHLGLTLLFLPLFTFYPLLIFYFQHMKQRDP